MAARTSRRLWRFSAAWFSRCACGRRQPFVLDRLCSSSSNTPCISCHCRRGSDRCVRAWPSGSGFRLRRMASAVRATLLADARFHELLLVFDGRSRRPRPRTRAGRCRHCDGALHSAKFKRKPRAAVASSAPSTTSASASAAPSTAAGAERRRRSLRFPRPPRLCRGDRRADRHPEARRDGRPFGAAFGCRQRRPPHDRTLAPLVARRVHGDAVLADRACPVHAHRSITIDFRWR